MPGKHDKYQIDIIKMNLNTAWQTQDHAGAALDPVLLPSPPHPSFPALSKDPGQRAVQPTQQARAHQVLMQAQTG